MARRKNKKQKLEKKKRLQQQQLSTKKKPVTTTPLSVETDSDSSDSGTQQQQQQQRKLSAKKKTVLTIPLSAETDSDSSDPGTQTDKIQKLVEPYSKDQLIEFLCDAALSDPSILSLIRSTADRDVTHRKIFVHGFGWDTTKENIVSAFEQYGEIEDCNVVVDKNTGRAKGYGFVLFKTRAGAAKALKQPQKRIRNRTATCQLASVGPGTPSQAFDNAGRKIYVSNVQPDADPDKLRSFFDRFGEIEDGPLGFDQVTGKSRGFALFVYRTQEGARKVLEEPHKVFEGHQLHCQIATDPTQKVRLPGAASQQGLPPGPAALAAAAAAQNLALFTQNPSLNPAFNALLGNPTAGLIGGNSMVGSSDFSAGLGGYGAGLGGYGAALGGLSGSHSVLGPYGMHTIQGQGPQAYQSAHFGQSSVDRAYAAGGAFGGFPPYM